MGFFGKKNKTEKSSSVKGKQGKIVKCSKCGRHLEPIGSMFDQFQGGITFGGVSKADLKQWGGWVCTKCNMIFCWHCEPPRDPMFCRNCGKRLQAAAGMFLKQIRKS